MFKTYDPATMTVAERIETVAAFIEKLEWISATDAITSLKKPGFNMAIWDAKDSEESACGTVCCIGGWASRIFRSEHNDSDVGELFNLDDREANRLFYPDLSWTAITVPQAVAVLRHLAKTGNVDWSVAKSITG